jgi:ribosome biogenesis GTPase
MWTVEKKVSKYDRILVGDRVRVSLNPDGTGVLEEVYDRIVVLRRPAVANVTQVAVILALSEPMPDFLLLDRFLVIAGVFGLKQVICFNKVDLASNETLGKAVETYSSIGYRVVVTSAKSGQGIEHLRQLLCGELSVFAGQSGVGKSALINALCPGFARKEGSISEKLGRGRHTTRTPELLSLDKETFVVDTPGFTSSALDVLEKGKLSLYFPEIEKHLAGCRFLDCLHRDEPDCEVKRRLKLGEISGGRYANYITLLGEIEEAESRRY